MQAVDILGGIDRRHHRQRIEMAGEGQLDQDAVHRVVGIEPLDQRQQFLLGVVSSRTCSKLSMPSLRAILPLLRT